RTRRLLKALHDPASAACVQAERALLETLGGGCHLPLGALGQIENVERKRGSKAVQSQTLRLRAVLAHPDGSLAVSHERRGSPKAPRALGRALARDLLKLGGRELLQAPLG